ncbi:MAG: transcriptional repressor [Clostridiales bacterium]|nr:MAG: transcriptional repressor [Clostridiales bacterium]
MTKQRALILRLIQESDQHPTAEQIYEQARREMPGIALATVYNNLIWLAEHEKIKKISFYGGKDRYDKSTVPHIHLICDRCGLVRDYPSEGLREEMESRLGFPVGYYELAIHCLCPACSKNEASNKNF